jgi:hypothetical protein
MLFSSLAGKVNRQWVPKLLASLIVKRETANVKGPAKFTALLQMANSQ